MVVCQYWVLKSTGMSSLLWMTSGKTNFCHQWNSLSTTGVDPGFSNWGGGGGGGGVQKIMHSQHTSQLQSAKSLSAEIHGWHKGPGSSRVLNALSCYLSLILKHSDTKRDSKNNMTVDHFWGRGARLLHPHLDPSLVLVTSDCYHWRIQGAKGAPPWKWVFTLLYVLFLCVFKWLWPPPPANYFPLFFCLSPQRSDPYPKMKVSKFLGGNSLWERWLFQDWRGIAPPLHPPPPPPSKKNLDPPLAVYVAKKVDPLEPFTLA